MLTSTDQEQLKVKNISEAQIETQLAYFQKGFPYLDIITSATVGKGIQSYSKSEEDAYIEAWEAYLTGDNEIVKFVPASGAASRMFKDLFEFLDCSHDELTTPFIKRFFEGLTHFAFYDQLNEACLRNAHASIPELLKDKQYKAIVTNLLSEGGLNYSQLPKGLLLFYAYDDSKRTAMEEHLVEGALYARNKANNVNLHFTVSPEHRVLFEELTKAKVPCYAKQFNVAYSVTFSEQKSSTDTIAVDMDNQPFRDNGKLLFRPGGHGALIENLNDLSADIVFIKNIDNVVPDAFKAPTVRYKQLLAGVLVSIQKKVNEYLHRIDSGQYTHDELIEMLYFLQEELCIKNPETKYLEDAELVLYIKSKLNRPIRVCGIVRNQGEAGGGPFLVVNPDDTVSPQLLESSQIDLSNPEKKAMFEQGTHFNPVDLVCALKDYKGEKFNLPDYVDPATGFISYKSKDGKELKALELPGLWNGAMSDWNTIFVEVPIETFNPVKVINDLLELRVKN